MAADPTAAIRSAAARMPDVLEGTSCNQSSFRVGKSAFLYLGPGAKGVGFKAMFKLSKSMPRARELAAREPDRFEVGSTGWVTVRFGADAPLAKSIWQHWLRESYALCSGKA
ncbi:MAG: MmcQ/YjbR family DNA-binding protein [Planctomycetes bacterium]|nr:MmcQ/YjbR family DNA-binding protein [Planctomycetota bacterium]